jgi:hypothetical protein
MLGIVLFVVLMVAYSQLFYCPQQSSCSDNIDHNTTFPEDIFQLLEDEQIPPELPSLYDPWTDESLEISTPSKSVPVNINNQPNLLLPPATQSAEISLVKIIQKQKYQNLKSACSLLKNYGFISKNQKLSGKGATKEKLIKYLQAAITNQHANALLAGYLKTS